MATATHAHAELPARITARLYYQKAGASGCPDVELIRAAVSDRMGYDPFVDTAPLIVLAAVTMQPDRTRRARISVIDGMGTEYGQREISSTAPTCDELASTMALVISVAIPAATQYELEARRAAQLEALKRASYVPLSTVTAESAEIPEPESDRFGWSLQVGGRVSTGAVPGIAPGFALGFGVRRATISGALEFLVDVANTQKVGEGSVDAALYRGALVLCRHGAAFGLCALVAAGGLHAEGHGFNQDGSVTNRYVGIGGRLMYELQLPRRFGAILYVEAESAVEGSSLAVTGETTWTWVAPGAALSAGIAMRTRFP